MCIFFLRYGRALKHFRYALQCQLFVSTMNNDKQIGSIIRSIGDCYLEICKNWCELQQYTNELKMKDCYNLHMSEILENDSKNDIHKGNICNL